MYLCAHARAERYVSEKEVGRNDVGSFIRVYVYASKRQDSEFTDADVTGDGGCIYNRVGVSGTMINSGIPVLPFFFPLFLLYLSSLRVYVARLRNSRGALYMRAWNSSFRKRQRRLRGYAITRGVYKSQE